MNEGDSKIALRARALFEAGRALQPGPHASQPPSAPPRWGPRLAVAGATVAAVAWVTGLSFSEPSVISREVFLSEVKGIDRPPGTAPPVSLVRVQEREVAPVVNTEQVPTSRPALAARAPVPARVPAAPTLEEQLELLNGALRALRIERDPSRALTLLAQSEARFPRGVFALEVSLASAEAQRALGRFSDALASLDRLSEVPPSRRHELSVLRGELLTSLGRCGEAAPLFQSAVAASGTLGERALLGAARCADTLGDRVGASAWLRRYEQTFPRGALGDEATVLHEQLGD